MVNYYTTIQSILNYTRMFFDILIMWLLLYYTIKIVRNNSRTDNRPRNRAVRKHRL